MDDVESALTIIEYARSIHQRYADNPQCCNKMIGSVAWHKKWVKNYNHLEKVINELSARAMPKDMSKGSRPSW